MSPISSGRGINLNRASAAQSASTYQNHFKASPANIARRKLSRRRYARRKHAQAEQAAPDRRDHSAREAGDRACGPFQTQHTRATTNAQPACQITTRITSRRAEPTPLFIAMGASATQRHGSLIRASSWASRRWLKSRRIIVMLGPVTSP